MWPFDDPPPPPKYSSWIGMITMRVGVFPDGVNSPGLDPADVCNMNDYWHGHNHAKFESANVAKISSSKLQGLPRQSFL